MHLLIYGLTAPRLALIAESFVDAGDAADAVSIAAKAVIGVATR